MIPFETVHLPVQWIALVVRPRAERNVQARLANANIESFVPWHRVRRRWSDRVKVLEENLFPGYVFCRSAFAERFTVLKQPGVQLVVGSIPEPEIVALRRTIASELPLGPWPFLHSGQRVRIEHGVLAGIEGTLARDCPGWRVVISVDALQQSVAVEVDRDMIRPMER
jgi:transcription antitermination factor NusG